VVLPSIAPGFGRLDLVDKLGNRLAFVRDPDGFFEDFFVAGDDLDVLPATSSGDLEQFFVHRVSGNHQCIDGFALGPVAQ
jgi:hypothetical protein